VNNIRACTVHSLSPPSLSLSLSLSLFCIHALSVSLSESCIQSWSSKFCVQNTLRPRYDSLGLIGSESRRDRLSRHCYCLRKKHDNAWECNAQWYRRNNDTLSRERCGYKYFLVLFSNSFPPRKRRVLSAKTKRPFISARTSTLLLCAFDSVIRNCIAVQIFRNAFLYIEG